MRHLPNLKLPEATLLLGGRVRPPETGMLPFHLGESAAEQAVTLPTGLLPCPVHKAGTVPSQGLELASSLASADTVQYDAVIRPPPRHRLLLFLSAPALQATGISTSKLWCGFRCKPSFGRWRATSRPGGARKTMLHQRAGTVPWCSL